MGILKTVGIENYRIFNKQTFFDFAPITLLTGPNNSGKSSLIKLLKLLKESYFPGSDLNSLRFQSGGHHLGDFKKSLSWNSESEKMSITLPFPLKHFDERFLVEIIYVPEKKSYAIIESIKIYNDNRVLLKYTMKGDKNMYKGRNRPMISDIDIDYLLKTVKKHKNEYENNKKKDKDDYNLKVGDVIDLDKLKNDPKIKNEIQLENSIFYAFYNLDNNIDNLSEKTNNISTDELLFDFYCDGKLVNNDPDHYDSIMNIYNELTSSSSCFFWYNLPEIAKETCFESLNSAINNINTSIPYDKIYNIIFSNLGELVFNVVLSNNIRDAVKRVERTFINMTYLSVNRGDQSRVYFGGGSFEITDLLYQYDEISNEFSNKKEILDFLNNSLYKLGIGREIIIERIENSASIIKIKTIDNKKTILLSDLGFGYSQIIPILLKITLNAINAYYVHADDNPRFFPSILILEEPEANLHPDLQSKLADVIVDAAEKFNIQFIIETHSEYFIRKFQLLTAKNKIKSKDTIIFYFDKINHTDNTSKIKSLKIREDGMMNDDFGEGFFDEATKLTIELLKTQNIN